MERRNFLKNLAFFTSAAAIPVGALAAEKMTEASVEMDDPISRATPVIQIKQDFLNIAPHAGICVVTPPQHCMFSGYAGEDIGRAWAITLKENGCLYPARYHTNSQDDDIVLGFSCSDYRQGQSMTIAVDVRFFYHDETPMARKLYLSAERPGCLSTIALPNQVHVAYSLTKGRILVRSNI